MVVALVLSLSLAQAPAQQRVLDVPLMTAEGQLTDVQLSAPFVDLGVAQKARSAELKKTWSTVLFWTGAGVLATGMYMLVQSVQGPEPYRPVFGRDAMITCSAAVGLLGGGVALGISADSD